MRVSLLVPEEFVQALTKKHFIHLSITKAENQLMCLKKHERKLYTIYDTYIIHYPVMFLDVSSLQDKKHSNHEHVTCWKWAGYNCPGWGRDTWHDVTGATDNNIGRENAKVISVYFNLDLHTNFHFIMVSDSSTRLEILWRVFSLSELERRSTVDIRGIWNQT